MMALRLKKDVQKASYYVWFLGAQEARELRGERVLTSTIPDLIERSREQDALKVTLQISPKGLKIIQVCLVHYYYYYYCCYYYFAHIVPFFFFMSKCVYKSTP